jgi:hypothetical protein
MPEPPSIFISYARKDAAGLAKRLYHDLAALGFAPWLDTERVEGGAVWTVEIEDAIDRAQVTLALLTPASYRSEICRAEQLRSLRKGKCVIPLLAAPDADRPLHLEARNYRDFMDDRAYAANFPMLLSDVASRNGIPIDTAFRATRVRYVTSPPTVANYIHRPGALRALRDALFRADEHRPIALLWFRLWLGMPGS